MYNNKTNKANNLLFKVPLTFKKYHNQLILTLPTHYVKKKMIPNGSGQVIPVPNPSNSGVGNTHA